MSEKRNIFSVTGLLLLFLTAVVGSFLGTYEEAVSLQTRISEQRTLHQEPETLAENLPYTPSATYRFSSRQSRTVPATSRIRSWTPAETAGSAELVIKDFPPSICFALPENVQAVCTAHCLYTSPVRAGPEYIILT